MLEVGYTQMSRTCLRFSKLTLVGLSLWRPSHHDLLYKSQQLPLPSFTVFIRPEVCEGLERETGDSSRKTDILGAQSVSMATWVTVGGLLLLVAALCHTTDGLPTPLGPLIHAYSFTA